MTKTQLKLALAAALTISGSAALFAVAQGRVVGTVRDLDGKPLAGVRVEVTLEGVESFRLDDTTDAKGDYSITLLDATRTYDYTFQKDGYQTFVMNLKIPVGATERHDIEMLTLEEARRRGPSGREPTPAERAVLIFNEGAEASQMGDTVTARAKFEEAMSLDPNLAAARTALATLEFADGGIARAVELAEQARALDSSDVQALRILAEGYAKLGDPAKARAASEALAAVDPKTGADDLYRQAVEAYNAGNTEQGAGLALRALEVDPEHPQAHYIAGVCLAGTDAAAARQHLETFLRLAPDDANAEIAREMLSYLN